MLRFSRRLLSAGGEKPPLVPPLSSVNKHVVEKQREIETAEAEKLASVLGVEDQQMRSHLHKLTRLSSFSYGLAGLMLCAALAIAGLKRKLDGGDEKK